MKPSSIENQPIYLGNLPAINPLFRVVKTSKAGYVTFMTLQTFIICPWASEAPLNYMLPSILSLGWFLTRNLYHGQWFLSYDYLNFMSAWLEFIWSYEGFKQVNIEPAGLMGCLWLLKRVLIIFFIIYYMKFAILCIDFDKGFNFTFECKKK